MHSYAGNPAIFPQNVGLVDDADLNPATAGTLDVAPQNLADRTAWLYSRVGPFGALNWRELVQGFTPASGTGGNPVAGQNCTFWDYVNNVWIVPFVDTTLNEGAPYTNAGFDITADMWSEFGGSSGPTFSGFAGNDFPASLTLAANSTTYLVAIVSPGANRTKIISMTPAGGAPTNVLTLPGSTTITSIQMINGVSGGPGILAPQVVVAGFGSTDAANTVIWYSSDPGGTVWNAQAVGTVIGAGAPELLVKPGLINSIGGFMVIPILAPVSEPGTAYAYWTSTTGTVWTQRTLNGVIANNETPIGLAFGADGIGPCWILVTQVGATSTCNWYRSADGLAWAFIGTTTTRTIQDLSVIGTLWVATVFDSTAGNPIYGATANPVYGAAGASYTVFSTDGCHTFKRSQGTLSKNLAPGGGRFQRAKVASSNQQFCLYNSSQLRFSDAVIAVPFT